jgi:ActD protein
VDCRFRGNDIKENGNDSRDNGMKAIYGLFPDPESAQRAMTGLRSKESAWGFTARDICVMSSEPFEEYDFGWRKQKTPMPWLAALGGLIGGTSGYLLSALTQRSYPLPTGNMPIVALWPSAIIVYELTMLGAIVTTLITLLISARIPNWRPKIYDPAISDGKILVGVVNPPEKVQAQLEEILRQAGASEIKEFQPMP